MFYSIMSFFHGPLNVFYNKLKKTKKKFKEEKADVPYAHHLFNSISFGSMYYTVLVYECVVEYALLKTFLFDSII